MAELLVELDKIVDEIINGLSLNDVYDLLVPLMKFNYVIPSDVPDVTIKVLDKLLNKLYEKKISNEIILRLKHELALRKLRQLCYSITNQSVNEFNNKNLLVLRSFGYYEIANLFEQINDINYNFLKELIKRVDDYHDLIYSEKLNDFYQETNNKSVNEDDELNRIVDMVAEETPLIELMQRLQTLVSQYIHKSFIGASGLKRKLVDRLNERNVDNKVANKLRLEVALNFNYLNANYEIEFYQIKSLFDKISNDKLSRACQDLAEFSHKLSNKEEHEVNELSNKLDRLKDEILNQLA
ncbi:MAG: hypothetical protein WC307_04080 [Candidatus Nanoarchaeia archaeon]|jgi:hypothetical protein